MLQTYYHFVKPNVVHYHSDLASVWFSPGRKSH